MSVIGPSVKTANYASYPTQTINLSLNVVLGGDAESLAIESIGLSLVVSEFGVTTSTLEEPIDLSLIIRTGDDFPTFWSHNEIGLRLDFTKGDLIYNLIVVWEPWESPLLTGKNYTYIVHLALSGTDIEDALIVVRFEGSYVTEKTTNATGFVEYWAVVGSPDLHTWTYTIYEDGIERSVVYKDILYEDGGPGPDPDPPPGPGPDPDTFDLPTEPGSLFVVLDFLPVMVFFGIFGFSGMLFMGRLGILFGVVAALFVTTAMGTLPRWVLFFAILIAILVVVFKLKSGGSKVTVNNGGNA